jgi:nitroreductase
MGMANPVLDVARTVLAVREFQDKPIPDEVLRRIVEAGRLSASSINQQPWHFVLVRSREAMRELVAVRKKVGLPDSYEVLAVVPFGYPKRALGKGKKKRKPLGEVVSAERFGVPFA